jgi:hypothetical protein
MQALELIVQRFQISLDRGFHVCGFRDGWIACSSKLHARRSACFATNTVQSGIHDLVANPE